MPENNDRARRLCILRISFEVLHEMLLLPDSCEIVAAEGGLLNRGLDILVRDDTLEPVPEYMQLKVRNVAYETEYIARPRFKEYV